MRIDPAELVKTALTGAGGFGAVDKETTDVFSIPV